MAPVRNGAISYDDFRETVRRFNQAALLSTVTQISLALPERPRVPEWRDTPPWALAAVAKASICYGNRYRVAIATPGDVRRFCLMYMNINPVELQDPDLSSGASILIRTAYEQFPYQESLAEEVGRTDAFFNGYSGRKSLEVLSPSSIESLVGAPLVDAVGVALMLHASAQKNQGLFRPAWLDQPNFEDVLHVISREKINRVVDAVFKTTFDKFKVAAREAPHHQLLTRYAFNPLLDKPFVEISSGDLLAPVPQLIARKLSPIELYYSGVRKWGNSFARDMGHLFEDYVGRQLRIVPGAELHEEIEYVEARNHLMSVDWILVLDELVVLIEAKASKVPLGARIGDESLKNQLNRTLGKAFVQIDRTHKAILDRRPEFAHIPADRRIIGIATTLDASYMGNGSMVRPLLPSTNVSVLVASVREIEHLVAISQKSNIGQILTNIVDDPELATHGMSSALSSQADLHARNPLLDASWAKYPWGAERE